MAYYFSIVAVTFAQISCIKICLPKPHEKLVNDATMPVFMQFQKYLINKTWKETMFQSFQYILCSIDQKSVILGTRTKSTKTGIDKVIVIKWLIPIEHDPIQLCMLQVKIRFRLKFFYPDWLSISSIKVGLKNLTWI